MKTEDVKRWEIVESRGKRFLRDRHKNEGILIEIHDSQIMTENEHFIIIFCYKPDFNFKMYCNHLVYDPDISMYLYMFKKRGNTPCYTLYP